VGEFTRFERPGISGFLHSPNGAGDNGFVLTHGAGGNCRAPLLVAARTAMAAEMAPNRNWIARIWISLVSVECVY